MLVGAPWMVSGNWDWVGASEGPVWTFPPAHLGSLIRTSRKSSSFSQHVAAPSVSGVSKQLELPTQGPVSDGTGRKKAFLTAVLASMCAPQAPLPCCPLPAAEGRSSQSEA